MAEKTSPPKNRSSLDDVAKWGYSAEWVRSGRVRKF